MSRAYLHFDDLYQCTRPVSCAHEQKACMHYALSRHLSIVMATIANKRHYLSRLWSVFLDLKHTEASFSPNLIDSLCLQVPRSREVAIFVITTTQPITLPLAHARGVNMRKCHILVS